MIKFFFLFIIKNIKTKMMQMKNWNWSTKTDRKHVESASNVLTWMKRGKSSGEFGIICVEEESMVIGFLIVVPESWKWLFSLRSSDLICLPSLKLNSKKSQIKKLEHFHTYNSRNWSKSLRNQTLRWLWSVQHYILWSLRLNAMASSQLQTVKTK